MALTKKEIQLVVEYVNNGFCKLRAYKTVYGKNKNMSDAVAGTLGTRKFKKVEVQQYLIEYLNTIMKDKVELSVKIIKEYEKLAFSDLKNHINDDGEIKSFYDDNNDTRCIQELKVVETDKGTYKKIKLHDKKGALDSLAKIVGLASDKIDITSGGEKIQIVIPPELTQKFK